MNLFRAIDPSLLPKRSRGREASMNGVTALKYGEEHTADGVADIELLEEYHAAREQQRNAQQSDNSDDDDNDDDDDDVDSDDDVDDKNHSSIDDDNHSNNQQVNNSSKKPRLDAVRVSRFFFSYFSIDIFTKFISY